MQFFELKTENILEKDNYYIWVGIIKKEANLFNAPIFNLLDYKLRKDNPKIKSYLNKILESQETFNYNINNDLVIFTDPSCLLWEYILNKKPKCVNIYFNHFKGMYSDSFFITILKNLINKNPKLKVYLDGDI